MNKTKCISNFPDRQTSLRTLDPQQKANLFGSRRGSALTECLISLPVHLSAVALMSAAALLIFAKALMGLDMYRLARAHLYGNDLSNCAPSNSLWPQSLTIRPIYKCESGGNVIGQISYRSFKIKHTVSLSPTPNNAPSPTKISSW